MRSTRRRIWRKLAKIGLPVVIVTQREGGLWALPTSDTERGRTYARPGTVEARQRSGDPFGYDSISITWRALHALHEAFGNLPSTILLDAFRAIEDLRNKAGAYGRRRDGWKAEASVNESSRHSAAGLMTRLEFGDFVSPPSRIDECVPTVRWLIEYQLEEGGWAYQQAHKQDGPEPMSTSYCLAALCEFERRAGRSLLTDLTLADPLDRALERGFDRLMAMRASGNWKFQYDQKDTELADTAHVAWMLLLATTAPSALNNVRSTARSQAVEIALWIIRQSLKNGMPAHISGSMPSQAASIHTLFMALSLSQEELDDQTKRLIEAIDTAIIRSVKLKEYWRQISTWDWCVFAQLSTRRAEATNSIDHELIELSQSIRQAAFSGNLLRQTLSSGKARILPEGQMPILYALSRGQPNTVPSTRLEVIYNSWPIWLRWLLPQAPAAAIGYFISEALRSFH